MTHASLFNENWFRVRDLTPILAPDVVVSRHIYRLQPNYILRRKSTRRWHRMSSMAYELLMQFDGQKTVAQVWEKLLETQGEKAPDQSEVIGLLSQLHEADMLIVDGQLDPRMLLDRKKRMQEQDRKQRYWNPLHIRVKLFDPEALLVRLDTVIPRRGFAVLCGCMGMLLLVAGVVLAPQWQEIVSHLDGNTVFDPATVILLVILYPLMKLLHELAHGLVVKRFGGEVREFGLAMLVLFPNPYVDASAASMFVSKRQRMLVSAAGIAVELCLAAIAALVWSTSTGLVQDAALTVMVLGSVSTLLFNGNPLLKFDGYYILSDYLEIPNLASRSRQYILGTLAKWLRLEVSAMPAISDGREKFWLIAYGLLSTVYRLLLMAFIAWVISGQYFFFGVLLACYIAFSMLLLPLWKLVRYAQRQSVQGRTRLAVLAGAISLSLTGAAFAVPGPSAITTDGIVWLPEQSVLRLDQPCEVVQLFSEPGADVEQGQHLFDCATDLTSSDVNVIEAQLRRIDAQRTGLRINNPAEHERLTNQRAALSVQYELAKDRLRSMTVLAPVDGQFLIEGNTDLVGRHIPANAVVGYVVPQKHRTVRVALTQLQAGYLSGYGGEAEIFFVDAGVKRQVATTHIIRRTPKATRRASVAALTTLGGGEHRAQPSDSGAILEQPVFDLELIWPDELDSQMIGTRLRVRIEHSPASLPRLINDHMRDLLFKRIESS